MTTSTPSWFPTYSRKRISRRKFVGGTAAGLGAAALIACGGDSGGGSLKFNDAGDAQKPGTVWNAANNWKLEDETKEAVKGGAYRSFMDMDQAGSFDGLIQAPSQVPFSSHVHEYLMGKNRSIGVDPTSQEASVPVPVLAQSLEMASDGLTVTFKMRPNVKFHPIAPVNSRVMDIDDWKTTLERFLALSAQREPLLEILDKTEYPDRQTMVMRLKFPYAPFMDRIYSERFAFQIIPKELNLDDKLAGSLAIGTGYKALDKHQPSVTMDYKKHAEYWGGEPFIDRWNFPIIPEYSNRYAQFVAGNIVDFSPNSREVLKLSQDVPGAVIVAQPINEEQFARIIFGRDQAETKAWKDARVRIALRRATDMRGIGEFQANKTQFEAAGIPVEVRSRSHAMMNPTYWLDPEKNELGPVSQNYLFNIEEARKLLTAAGVQMPVEIDFRVLPAAGEVPEEEKLTIDSMNRSGLFKVTQTTSINTVEHRNCRSLRQCVGIVTSSINEDVEYAMREYYSKGPRPGGEPAYASPKLDQIADAYRKETDGQKRIQLVKDMQLAAGEFFPTVPRPHTFTTFTFRWPWLHNTNHGWNGVSLDGRPIWGGHKQWLDANMPRRNG